MPIESYHMVWLASHPNRTLEWLQERMRDGFDVHHLDGDHSNDAKENLVLIECLDHMRLHGTSWNRMVRNPLRKRMAKPAVTQFVTHHGMAIELNSIRYPVGRKSLSVPKLGVSCRSCGQFIKGERRLVRKSKEDLGKVVVVPERHKLASGRWCRGGEHACWSKRGRSKMTR